jgi:hypothetical protein
MPLLSNFALKYSTQKVQENQAGLKLNGILQLPVYAKDVNLLGDKSTIDQGWSRCWGRLRPSPAIYIHTGR